MGFFIFLVVAGIILYSGYQKRKQEQAQWHAAAARLGLGYYPGSLGTLGRIAGLKGGHFVEINTYSRSHNNQTTTCTRYKVKYDSPIQADFLIVRQTALHKTELFPGLEDIEVGDPAFDDSALVRGLSPERIIEFLTPERRNAITRLLGSYPDVKITNEYVELNKSTKDTDPHAIYNTARLMLSVTNDLTDVLPTLAEKRHAVEIDEEPSATPILHVDRPAVESVQEIKAVEPDFDMFTSSNPVVPDPVWVDVNTQEPPQGPEPEAAAGGSAESPVVESDLRAIAEQLYRGDSGATLRAEALFTEQFENTHVTGEGKLQRISRFSYDPVFVNCAGVKASFCICELPGPYSSIRVMADVMFPEAEYEELRQQIDSTLPISGKLIGQSSYMNQFYIVSESCG